ncbi:MAG TPA: Ig-like domain-containing protein [Candidatus Anaerobutyricum avicola]|nr:Ig-like domain-containing protein [Candidatus Anaerobutyricum avicola]
MKNRKSTMLKSCMLFAAVFLIGAAVPASAKAAPKLSSKKITLKVGQKKKLKVKNVKKKKIKWSSKKKAVATVNKKGVVKAKKKGKTTIIAKVGKKKLKCKVVVKKADNKKKSNKKNNKKKDTSKISKAVKKELPSAKQYRVFNGPDKMVLNKSEDLFRYVYWAGSPIKTPSNGAKIKGYKWVSSNPAVVLIDKYGIATAKKVGTSKISVKYLDRSGEWRETDTWKVEVINAGDVSFSFSYGLNKEWITEPEPGFHYTVDENDPDAFNYVNVTVNNNSDMAITMDNEFDLYFNSWSAWKTTDNKDVIVPAHTTMIVLYHCNGMRRISEIEQMGPTYTINGEKIYPVYDVAKQVWEYQ